MRIVLLLFIFINSIFATTFKVASYNVENLFDLENSGYEYKEYKPSKHGWNLNKFNKKIDNISKVIDELNANILGLQEIESKLALKSLMKKLNYKYYAISNDKFIKTALLSNYPIIYSKNIKVAKKERKILEVAVKIDNITLIIFVNHWKSKRHPESYRIKYSQALKNRLKELKPHQDYILLGDFNSNYNESQTMIFEKRLNDTNGYSGINHILETTLKNGKYVTEKELISRKNRRYLYNLWFELPIKDRFSNKFKKLDNTLDNILIPYSMYDGIGIDYLDNSFGKFNKKYLFKNKNSLFRWNHKIVNGFSDHLPIYAKFTTNNQNFTNKSIKNESKNYLTIKDIYKNYRVNGFTIKDATIIYKHKKNAILKDNSNRAIYLYNCASNLKLGYRYTLDIEQVKKHKGLFEITKISKYQKISKNSNYKKLISNAKSINIFAKKSQNEIVKSLKGKYIDKYLLFDNKRIKIYSKNRNIIPKNGTLIEIKRGHLVDFMGKREIKIYSKKDYKVLE